MSGQILNKHSININMNKERVLLQLKDKCQLWRTDMAVHLLPASGFDGGLVAGFCGHKASWISAHKVFSDFVINEQEDSKWHCVQPPNPATGERHNDSTLAK